MNANRLLLAIFKSLICITCIFFIGYFGYNYPDAMIWVICIAILFAFSWYFYVKDNGD